MLSISLEEITFLRVRRSVATRRCEVRPWRHLSKSRQIEFEHTFTESAKGKAGAPQRRLVNDDIATNSEFRGRCQGSVNCSHGAHRRGDLALLVQGLRLPPVARPSAPSCLLINFKQIRRPFAHCQIKSSFERVNAIFTIAHKRAQPKFKKEVIAPATDVRESDLRHNGCMNVRQHMRRVYVCIYVCMHVCVCACVHVCMRASMHVCTYVCMYVCTYVCHVRMYHTYLSTYTRIHNIHTYIHDMTRHDMTLHAGFCLVLLGSVWFRLVLFCSCG